LVSRISTNSPKSLPRTYIKKKILENEGGRIIYRYMLPKFRGASPSTSITVRLPSLVEKLRRSKEKEARKSASIA
jgi:hypothetical protein